MRPTSACSWTASIQGQGTGSHSWISSGLAMPSASRRARRRGYFESGNLWVAGSGKVNRSWLQRSMATSGSLTDG
jgi:hypothetical protein